MFLHANGLFAELLHIVRVEIHVHPQPVRHPLQVDHCRLARDVPELALDRQLNESLKVQLQNLEHRGLKLVIDDGFHQCLLLFQVFPKRAAGPEVPRQVG